MRKTKEQKEALENVGKIADKVNIRATNEVLATANADFKLSKTILSNIAEWCLNGDSDDEISRKLELTKKQWNILVSVCPRVLDIMEHSRAYADIIVGGSLLQAAIGGQKVRKQQIIKVGDYQDGVKIGEHVETYWVEEELPPNPMLLKFLAERKLNEKLGEESAQKSVGYRDIIDNMTEEDRRKLEMYSQVVSLDGNKQS